MVAMNDTGKKTVAEAHADALKIFKESMRPAIGRDALPTGVEDALQTYATLIADTAGMRGADAERGRLDTQVSIRHKIVPMFEGYANESVVSMAVAAYCASVNEALLGRGRGV